MFILNLNTESREAVSGQMPMLSSIAIDIYISTFRSRKNDKITNFKLT